MSTPQMLFRPNRPAPIGNERSSAAPRASDDVMGFATGDTRAGMTLPAEADLQRELLGVQAAVSRARRGRTLRAALGFAALGIGAALWAGQYAEDTAYRLALRASGTADDLTTASVRPFRPEATRAAAPAGTPRRYLVRRSIMQAPGEVCVIEPGRAACR